MSSLRSDVKYALRAIRNQPGVSLIVALTPALGLGVNATVLAMMDAMLLRPFQFRDYPRLVVLWQTTRGGIEREQVSPANFLEWRAQAHSVEQIVAWAWLDATLTGHDDSERVQGFRGCTTGGTAKICPRCTCRCGRRRQVASSTQRSGRRAIPGRSHLQSDRRSGPSIASFPSATSGR